MLTTRSSSVVRVYDTAATAAVDDDDDAVMARLTVKMI